MEQTAAQPQSDAAAPGAGQVYRPAPETRRTVGVLILGVAAIAVYALWSLGALLSGGLQGPEWVTAALMLAILACSPAVAWGLLEEYHATIRTDAAGLTYQTLGGVDLHYRWTQVHGVTDAPGPLGRLPFGDHARAAGRSAAATINQSTEGEPATSDREEIRPTSPDGPRAAEDASDAGPPGLLQLRVDPPATEGIANPLVRLLHRQAYAGTVPLHPGLADRPALLAEIAGHQSQG